MPLTVAQSRAFLAVAHRDRFGALFSVALTSGLRVGEAPGIYICSCEAGEWTRTIDLLITKHGPRLTRGARYTDRCLDAAYFTTAGAGLANLAGSIATFGWISLSSMLDLPSVHVITILCGSFTPATSR